MEAAVVSVSAGVITSLLGKLDLLKDIKKQQEEIGSLQAELRLLSAALLDAEMMEARNTQVQEWTRQVREVAYDIDDYIDLNEHHNKSRSIVSLMLKRPSFDAQMKRLKARVVEASERLKRFNLAVTQQVRSSHAATAAAHAARSTSTVTIHPPLLLGAAGEDPVGIQGPKMELVKRLDDDQQRVKVASILGMAGSGKTTLAVQVYRTLKERRFDTMAFVHVGPKPSVTTVLLDIITQVTPKPHKHQDIADERGAIKTLRDFLGDKRYLVVVDDLWGISEWKAINCALPQNSTRSRIIVTTRAHDVARLCSNHASDISYEMEALGETDAIGLFHRRIFGSEDKCQERECTQIHDAVLKISGGLPLTIIAVASFLATKAPKEWMMVINRSTLSSLLDQHPLFERMGMMLHLSYTDLPLSIRTCLLYLSVFPKQYEISRDRLIGRWIAEGFVPGTRHEVVWETGRSYFNELINRSLIQPLFVNDDKDGPMGCTVHDIIHDFLVTLSREENFAVTSDELESKPRDVIRRLSLNYNNQDAESSVFELLESRSLNLSQARSLTVLGRPPHRTMPRTLASFQLLRVLDLEHAEGLDNADLEDIGRLFNLRYLGLGGERITKLPKGIRKLQLLETLEIRRTEVRGLPRGAGQLQKLVRLLAKALDVVPAGVLKKMKELQQVSVVSVSSPRAINLLEELAMMERLRILEIKWGLREQDDSGIVHHQGQFVSFLSRASKSNIKSLSIHCDQACSIDFLADSSWDLPHHLQKLALVIGRPSEQNLCRIPRNLASCLGLTHLEISINLDAGEDILVIAKMPSLTTLKLSGRGRAPIIIITQGFERLKVFSFQRWEGHLGLAFEAGAMPQLWKLSLHFKVVTHQQQLQQLETEQQQGGRFVPDLHNLSSLKQVNVKIDCDGAMHTDVESVEEAIKKEMHAADGRNFKYELRRENEDKMKQADGGEREPPVQEECN